MQQRRRNKRGRRTYRKIVEAFIRHVGRRSRLPSFDELACAVGCSRSLIFFYFPDREHLLAAAHDYLKSTVGLSPGASDETLELEQVVRDYVDRWGRVCERRARPSRALLALGGDSPDFAPTARHVAERRLADLETRFAAELGRLPASRRGSLVMALELLTDFSSWTRLRSDRNTTAADIRMIWSSAIARLLAPPSMEDSTVGSQRPMT
jgi:AcrR family transcriptional regulator